MTSALLLSNSTNHGSGLLQHALEEIADLLEGGTKVVFFPYALRDHDGYTDRVRTALLETCDVIGAHEASTADLVGADAYFLGGGNTWRLLHTLHTQGLLGLVRRRVRSGEARYIGSSAGTNVACPSIRTTNDMPIVEPPSLQALGLVPFQINAHYIDGGDTPTHMGETREERLREFLEENDVPVLALREGAWLRVEGDAAHVGGTQGGRLLLRDQEATEVVTGTDVSHLLLSDPKGYDTRV